MASDIASLSAATDRDGPLPWRERAIAALACERCNRVRGKTLTSHDQPKSLAQAALAAAGRWPARRDRICHSAALASALTRPAGLIPAGLATIFTSLSTWWRRYSTMALAW